MGRARIKPHATPSRCFKQDPRWIFWGEIHPISEMACQHRPNRCFRLLCDLTSKARKTFFTKVLSQRAHFLYIAAPGVSMQTLLQSYSANNHGYPAFPVHQSTRLGSRSGAAAAALKTISPLIAPRHRIQPPSQAGVGFGLWLGSSVWVYPSPIAREIKLRRGPASWGMSRGVVCGLP